MSTRNILKSAARKVLTTIANGCDIDAQIAVAVITAAQANGIFMDHEPKEETTPPAAAQPR